MSSDTDPTKHNPECLFPGRIASVLADVKKRQGEAREAAIDTQLYIWKADTRSKDLMAAVTDVTSGLQLLTEMVADPVACSAKPPVRPSGASTPVVGALLAVAIIAGTAGVLWAGGRMITTPCGETATPVTTDADRLLVEANDAQAKKEYLKAAALYKAARLSGADKVLCYEQQALCEYRAGDSVVYSTCDEMVCAANSCSEADAARMRTIGYFIKGQAAEKTVKPDAAQYYRTALMYCCDSHIKPLIARRLNLLQQKG